MTPDSLLLLTGYSVAIVTAAMLGVWVQSKIHLTHTRMQLAMSFVAGLVLGVALYHLVPHSLARISGPNAVGITVWWMIIGMILMVLLLRVFQFHQHDFGNDGNHHHEHHAGNGGDTHSLNWLGITLGMGLHTLTEGAALGASVRSDSQNGVETELVSFGMFLAALSTSGPAPSADRRAGPLTSSAARISARRRVLPSSMSSESTTTRSPLRAFSESTDTRARRRIFRGVRCR